MQNVGRPRRYKNIQRINITLERDDAELLDQMKGSLSRGEFVTSLLHYDGAADASLDRNLSKQLEMKDLEISKLHTKVDALEIRLSAKKIKAVGKVPMMVKALREIRRRDGELSPALLITWRKITGLSDEEIYAELDKARAVHPRPVLSSEDELRILASSAPAPISKSESASKSRLLADDSQPIV